MYRHKTAISGSQFWQQQVRQRGAKANTRQGLAKNRRHFCCRPPYFSREIKAASEVSAVKTDNGDQQSAGKRWCSRCDDRKNKRRRRVRWYNDGTDDSVSTLSGLLDWLTTGGNCSMRRGDDKQSGDTKFVLAAQIAARIHDSGVAHVRKPNGIITKVSQLEQNFRDAVGFLSNTGAGITSEAMLREVIEKRCPHYRVLKDVFGDRPSTRPLVMNEDAPFLSDNDFELGLGGGSAGEQEDTAPTSDESPKRAKQNNGTTKRWGSIRPRSPSVSSTLSEWSDLNSALSRTKVLQQEDQRRMHEKLELKRMQFQQATFLEERRVACAEEETKCRVLLFQAQAKKEYFKAQCEELYMKVELARNRMRLRDEGVSESEINELLPLPSS